MKIDEKLFDRIAHLARLTFSEDEKRAMMKDMSRIVSWVEKLDELDTEGVEPITSMSHEINRYREDKAGDTLNKEAALANAPQSEKGFYVVPKVIKE